MTVRDLMNEAIKHQYTGLILLIQLLVTEKKVITYNDDITTLDYYLQDKFRDKMNEHLREMKK